MLSTNISVYTTNQLKNNVVFIVSVTRRRHLPLRVYFGARSVHTNTSEHGSRGLNRAGTGKMIEMIKQMMMSNPLFGISCV